MNNENEIEKMAKEMRPNRLEEIYNLGNVIAGSEHFGERNDEFMLAQDILDADYGNVKQYQDEIGRLETELAHRKEDLAHADEKVFYREMAVKLEEEKIKKQAVKEFADMVVDTLDNYQYDDMTVREIVDSLITELYGADE